VVSVGDFTLRICRRDRVVRRKIDQLDTPVGEKAVARDKEGVGPLTYYEILEQRLFARSGVKPGRRRRSEPDWAALARELAARAVAIGALTYKSVASILQNNLDRAPQAAESGTVIAHQNLRGPGYFH
jgi:hypothetical protein